MTTDVNMSGRPRAAQIVSEAAAQLQGDFGEDGIPAGALMREVERRGGYARDSVLPSDFCYNVVNKAPNSFTHCILVRVGRGRCKHVGPDFPYTGLVFWKPRGGPERSVGQWTEGAYHPEVDPRLGTQEALPLKSPSPASASRRLPSPEGEGCLPP